MREAQVNAAVHRDCGYSGYGNRTGSTAAWPIQYGPSWRRSGTVQAESQKPEQAEARLKGEYPAIRRPPFSVQYAATTPPSLA